MARETMLTPNPHKAGSIARVVVINTDPTVPLVVHVDPIYDRPSLLRPLNPGYTMAIKVWNGIAAVAVIAGLALAIFWHWWAVIVGGIIGFVIMRHNRKSVADFIVQAVIEQKDTALALFKAHNLMWVAAPEKLTRDRT